MREGHEIAIEPAKDETDYMMSARLLSENEPWVTLGRTYEYSLEKVKQASGELYVAHVGGLVAGCVLIEMNGQLRGFIRSICVADGYRGLCIGTLLIQFAEKKIFQNHPNVFIFASSFNPRAKQLYLRLGYEEVGIFKNYIVQDGDEHLLRKTIGPSNEYVSDAAP